MNDPRNLPDIVQQSLMETNSFALLEFDKPMTMLQQKLYYLSAALIKNGDDPEENQLYHINIRDMAKATDSSPTSLRTNMERVVQAFTETNVNLRTAIDMGGSKTAIVLGIYQSIILDRNDPYQVEIRFNYDFRKKMLEMKKIHDIQYPVKTILDLHSKYAISLYVFLIASASALRDEFGISNGKYDIAVPKIRLLQVMQYDKSPGVFHQRALFPACDNLNKDSEIYIENGRPEFIKKGNAIVEYVFHIRITTSIQKPIFSKSLLQETLGFDLPQWDYLAEKAAWMGADKSLIGSMKLHNDRSRAWKSILYTLIQKGRNGRYLNAAFRNDYAGEYSTEHLVRVLAELHPEYQDDYIEQLNQEYDRQGMPNSPTFIEKLLKTISKKKTAVAAQQ